VRVWIPHESGLDYLPDGVDAAVYLGPSSEMPGDPALVEFWVPPFLSSGAVVSETGRMTSLRAIQLLSAGADAWVGRIPEGVTLCDARGVHDSSTSEWVVTAILASLRRFDHFARAQADHRWSYSEVTPTDELAGKRVLIIGSGSIGAALAARLAPFEVSLTHVARTARDGVHSVAELPRLLPEADIVVVLVPLTDQTRGLVDAGFLAAMRDGALLINGARGPVADTAALTKELGTGRIRAAVDVTDPEPLPPDHPLWSVPGLLLTPHVAGSVRGLLPRAYRLAARQMERLMAGDELINQVKDGY
jgi:phosphoglycerate dehydrogenase-like enzyme